MSLDPDELVHEPRNERRSNGYVGRDVMFAPRGEYVGESRVGVSDSIVVDVRLNAGVSDNWLETLRGYKIVNNGSMDVPSFDENVLGYVDDDGSLDTRENYWCKLKNDHWNVHIDNINSPEIPSQLELQGSLDDLDTAAVEIARYADDLANFDLEYDRKFQDRNPQVNDTAWELALKRSLNNAGKMNDEVRKFL